MSLTDLLLGRDPGPGKPKPGAEVTPLSSGEERQFRAWANANRIPDIDDPRSFYDYRGYWRDIASKGQDQRKAYDDGLHFPDTYKQHGHPTFSVESKYSTGPNDGGHWEGETYVPPKPKPMLGTGPLLLDVPGLPHIAPPNLFGSALSSEQPLPLDPQRLPVPHARTRGREQTFWVDQLVNEAANTGRALASGHGEGIPAGAAARLGVQGVPEAQRSGNIDMPEGALGQALHLAFSLGMPKFVGGQSLVGGMLRGAAGEDAPYSASLERGMVPDVQAAEHPLGALAASFIDPSAPMALPALAATLAKGIGRRAIGKAAEEAALAGTKVLDEAGQPKVVYHGTSAVFHDFDPAKLDSNALYGKGLYWTEDARMAGGDGKIGPGEIGYSNKGPAPEVVSQWQRDLFRVEEELRWLRSASPDLAPGLADRIKTWEKVESDLVSHPPVIPSVRPARLAIKNPLDIDAPLAEDAINKVVGGVPEGPRAAVESTLAEWKADSSRPIMGGELYELLARHLTDDRDAVNGIFRRAGYDGITHLGGRITGNAPHRVWIAWDRSQIRNPWGPPQFAAQWGAASPSLVASLAGGGVGAAVGGAYGDTPQERIRNALVMGGLGAGAGYFGARALAKGAEGSAAAEQTALRDAAIEEAQRFAPATEAGATRLPPPSVPPAPGAAGEIDPTDYINIGKLALDPTGEQRVAETVTRMVAAGEIPAKTVQPWTEVRRIANGVAERLGLDPKDLEVQLGKKGRLSGSDMLAMENVIKTNIESAGKIEARLADEAAPLTADEQKAAQTTLDAINAQSNALLARLSGARTAAGRDLNNLKILANSTMEPATWFRRAQERLGGPLTDEVRTKVRQYINNGDRAGLAKYVANLKKSTPAEKFVTLIKAGFLTAPPTHIANTLGNLTMAALETAKDAPAVVWDRLLSLSTKTVTKDFSLAGIAKASAQGARQGAREARQVLKGNMPEENMKWDQLREVNFDSAILNAYTKGVFRSLDAEDRVFRGIALYRSLAEQARVMAKAEALKGTALKQRVAELTAKPTDEMALRGIADANLATFRNKNWLAGLALGAKERGRQGAARMIAENDPMVGLANALPAGLELTVPFVNTPANVGTRAMEYSPLGGLSTVPGVIKLFRQAAKGSVIPELQRKTVERLGRSSIGTAPILAGYLLHRAGLMTASTPSDAGERGSQQLAGKQANAILLPDGKWHTLDRFAPGGNLMALGAHLSELSQKPDATATSVAAGATASIAKTLSEQSFLKGTQGILDAINDPDRSAARYAQQQAGAVIPAVVGRLAGGVDSLQRAPTGPLQAIESRIPGLSQRVPARINPLGQPVKREGGITGALLDPTNGRTDMTQQDPVIAEIARTGAQITNLSRRPGETPEAFQARQIHEGGLVRDRLANLVNRPEYLALSAERRKDAIEIAIRNARRDFTVAAKKLEEEKPGLLKRLYQKEPAYAAPPN